MPATDLSPPEDSDSRHWVAPEVVVPHRDDAGVLAMVVSVFVLTIGWLVLCMTWLLVALFAGASPGKVQVDHNEFAVAQQFVDESQPKVAAAEAELRLLDERMAELRADKIALAKERQAGVASVAAAIVQANELPTTPIRYNPTPIDEVSMFYINSFVKHAGHSGNGLSAISASDEATRQRMADLIIRGVRCGHADLVIAAMSLSMIDCPTLQAEFIELFLTKHPDPLAGPPRGAIDDVQIAAVLLRFCLLLPSPKRGDAVARVLFLFPQPSDSFVATLLNKVQPLESQDWVAMSGLLVHPNRSIRQFAMTGVPPAAAITAVEEAVIGKDYVRYVGAAAWFAEQQLDPQVRECATTLPVAPNQLLSVEQCRLLLKPLRDRFPTDK